MAANVGFAQSSNVRKVKTAFTKYQEMGGAETAGDLALKILQDAVEPAEAAIVHEKTKDDPELWTLYSLMYSNLALAEKNNDYAEKAKTAATKAKELDTDGKFADNLNVANVTLRNFYQTTGYDAWQKENFKDAYTEFSKGLALVPGDTTLTYFSAIAAIQTQDYGNAVKLYQQLVPVKEFSDHKTVVADLPKLYLSQGDTAKALEFAAIAVQEYPQDSDIGMQNIELNLMTGNDEKIISEIESQLKNDSNNKSLYYYLGLANSSAGNNEKAMEAYKKAVEIDPNYVDANLNTAALIMNGSNAELMALNDDKGLSNADYNAKVAEIKTKMGEAVPYLEKIIELQPDNTNALRNLKSYYEFVQDEAKAAEVQAKIDAVQ